MVLVCGLALAGCGDEGEGTANTSEQIQEQLDEAREAVAAAPEQPEPEVNPCEVLTEELIRANVTVPEGAEVGQRRGGRHASNLCTYSWQDPDFDQEAHTRDMMKRIRERMRKGGASQGIIEGAVSARSGGEVSFTHGLEADTEEEARRSFESSMRMLNKGMSREVEAGGKATKVTFQMSTEEVEGVGDQAHWSPRMQQLSVRAGTRIFHVSVKVEDEPTQNLELAKKLARAIIEADG